MTLKFDRELFTYFENLKRQMQSQPLLLGGYSSSGGGLGGPPAGFIGYLPQSRVTYDYLEAAASGVAPSGVSLLDNLNHIRYRIAAVESGVSQGKISVSYSGIELSSDVRVLNFTGDLKASISEYTATIDTGAFLSDNLSGQVDGIRTTFSSTNKFVENTLQVFHNGLHQLPLDYTPYSGGLGFVTTFTPILGDNLVATYKYYLQDALATGWGTIPWGSYWGT